MLRMMAALPLPDGGDTMRDSKTTAQKSSRGASVNGKGAWKGQTEQEGRPERLNRPAMPHKRGRAVWDCPDKAAGVSFRGDIKLKSEIPGEGKRIMRMSTVCE
jgi:hypothetical protein